MGLHYTDTRFLEAVLSLELLTGIAQVVVAAIRKRNITIPSDITLLYENGEDVEFIKSGRKLPVHSDNFQ